MAAKHYGDKEIGERIRELRVQKGISMEELSQKIGIDYSALSKIEKGTRAVQMYQAVALADALDTTCDFLFRGITLENFTVAKDLGLSDKTIETLRNWQDGVLEYFGHIDKNTFDKALNMLLEDPIGPQIIADIYRYLTCNPEESPGILEDYNDDGLIHYHKFDRFKELMLYQGCAMPGVRACDTAIHFYSEDILAMILTSISSSLSVWRDRIHANEEEK